MGWKMVGETSVPEGKLPHCVGPKNAIFLDVFKEVTTMNVVWDITPCGSSKKRRLPEAQIVISQKDIRHSPLPLCPQKIQHVLICERTAADEMGTQWLSAWACGTASSEHHLTGHLMTIWQMKVISHIRCEGQQHSLWEEDYSKAHYLTSRREIQ
jgi:hypothetical protein